MNLDTQRVALIVTPRFPPLLGGMEQECALLAEEFGRMGFRPVVITEQFGQDLPPREEVAGTLVIRVPSAPTRSLAVQLRAAGHIARHLLAFRRQTAFAVVRTFTLPALVVGLLKRMRLVSFPTLVTAETGGEKDDVVALEERPARWLTKWLVCGNDRLNALCQANLEHLVEFGYPQSKLTMIPNGIDISPWSQTVPPTRVERFLFLGRIDEAKGIFELVEALSRLRRDGQAPHLLVAGTGPDEKRLRSLVVSLGLEDCVEFAGLVPHEEIDRVFAETDCMVLPSWSEGMPLSVLEAASRHRVLILSDVGDMRRLFAASARIIAPGDVDSLAAAMGAAMDDRHPEADYEAVIGQVDIRSVARRLATSLSA